MRTDPTYCKRLVERASKGDRGAIAFLHKGFQTDGLSTARTNGLSTAMRDFIRETVLKTVRRHWGAGSCQMKKHSTRDEVVEEIIAKVIMRMIRHPPLLKSLLEKGRLLPYVIKCAENHVRDAHRWQGSRQRGIGYQQPMQPGELRNAVLEEYVERREACEQTLKKARGILGAKRYSDLLTHVRFGSHASKQEGTTDGQLSHTRRFLREAFAELDTEEVN